MKKSLGSLVLLATLALAQAPQEHYQRALVLERSEGKLPEAIEAYKRAAETAGKDRTLAAKALLQAAACYQRLGNSESRRLYERVLKEYGDQKDAVSVARAKLGSAATPSARQVWSSEYSLDSVSPDGRLGTFTDWNSGGNLAVRDLISGTSRRLTNTKPGGRDYMDGSRISPDGRQVAFMWAKPGVPWEFQVQVAPMDGSAQPRVVYRSPRFIFVKDWMPDGQSVLITEPLEQDQASWQMAMLSIRDGARRTLGAPRKGQINAAISPDGRYVAFDAESRDGRTKDIYLLSSDGSREEVAVQHEANDTFPVWTADGSHLLFMSDRTASGSLWTIAVRDGRPAGDAELVRSDINLSWPIRMTKSGALYYAVSGRSNRNVYRIALGDDGSAAGAPQEAAGQYVNSNWGAALSPDGTHLAYFSNRPKTVLVSRDLQSGQERVIPLNMEIQTIYFAGPRWLPDGRHVLVQARNFERRTSDVYRVDVASGQMEEAARDAGYGFQVSPDGKYIVCAKYGSYKIVRIDLGGGETVLVSVQDPTHVTNPAISPDGKTLAYLQESMDASTLMAMPISGGEPRVIHRFERMNGGARYNTLSWTPNQKHLLFVTEESRGSDLVIIPSEGGAPRRVGVTMPGVIKAPQLHPNGRAAFFSLIRTDDNQAWVLENFLPAKLASR